MYEDPKNARRNEVKVRFSDEELELLERAARMNHEQRATYAHDLLIEALSEMLKDKEDGRDTSTKKKEIAR